MSQQDLEIRPRPDQFKQALLFVLDRLGEGDQIDVHQEASPPWFRIVAREGESIALEMQRRGVSVQSHGV